MKLVGTFAFLLHFTLSLSVSENTEGQIEIRSAIDPKQGEIVWTNDKNKVPSKWHDKCLRIDPDTEKEHQCWCSQYWLEDESDLDYLCCSNCYVNGCFPPSARVLSTDGAEISMANLRTGTPVMAVDINGNLIESEILGFLDRQPQKPTLYATIETSSGKRLSLTPTHVVFTSKERFEEPTPIFAQEISVGDFIFEASNATVAPSKVISIQEYVERGAYVPLTKEGNLIVDGFFVSCYGSYPHDLSHNFLSLARALPQLISFRLGTEEACQGPLYDPASEEGCGESLYVTVGKRLSKTFVARFFDNSFSPSDVVPIPQVANLLGTSFHSFSQMIRSW